MASNAGTSNAVKLVGDSAIQEDRKKTLMNVARFCGFIAIFLTGHFFVNSPVYSTFGNTGMSITVAFFLCAMVLLMPFPSLVKIEGKINMLSHSAIRGILSFGSYFFFTWVGNCVDLHNDQDLRKASLFFLGYLLSNEYRYKIEEEFAICDGYLYAGFGLMLAQDKVSHYLVFFVGVAFLWARNCLQATAESDNSAGGEIPVTTASRTQAGAGLMSRIRESITGTAFGVFLWGFLLHFVFNSEFYAKLGFMGLGFTFVFFGVTFGLLFVELTLPKLDGLNVIVHCGLKAAFSIACYFLFNWVSISIDIHKDVSLMKASLCLLGYLLVLESKFHFEEEISLCDGFMYMGFAPMLAQNIVSSYAVFCIGFGAQVAKNYLIMAAKGRVDVKPEVDAKRDDEEVDAAIRNKIVDEGGVNQATLVKRVVGSNDTVHESVAAV